MAHELAHVMQQGQGVQRDVVQRERYDSLQNNDYRRYELDILKKYIQNKRFTYIGSSVDIKQDVSVGTAFYDLACYKVLIKGSTDCWKNFFTSFNNMDYFIHQDNAAFPIFNSGDTKFNNPFNIFVTPFLECALYPEKTINYVKFDYTANSALPEGYRKQLIREAVPISERISEGDIKNFLRALFDNSGGVVIDWSVWKIDNEVKGLFSQFISKYFYLYANEISLNDTTFDADKLRNILKDSNSDMLASYVGVGLALAESAVLSYSQSLDNNADSYTAQQQYLMQNAGRMLALANEVYKIKEEELKDAITSVTNIVKKTLTAYLPDIGNFATAVIEELIDIGTKEIVEMLVDKYKDESNATSFIVEDVLNKYLENLIDDGKVKSGNRDEIQNLIGIAFRHYGGS